MAADKEIIEKSTFRALWDSLSKNQRRFCIAMLECNSKADAAAAINIKPNTVYGWPKEIDTVVEMLLEKSQDHAVDMLASSLSKAVMVKIAGMDSGDERIRQDAATEIIDRIMGKPRQGFEHSGPGGGAIILQWPEENQ